MSKIGKASESLTAEFLADKQHVAPRELAETFGISERSVRRYREKHSYPYIGPLNAKSMTIIDKREKSPLSWSTLEDYYDIAIAIEDSGKTRQKSAVVIPPDIDKWLLMAIFGDLHFGTKYQDWHTLMKHTDLVLEEENAVAIQVGDLVNNAFSGRNRIRIGRYPPNDLLSSRDARRVCVKWFNKISSKMAAFVIGNHDDWSIMTEDLDIGEDVSDLIKGVFFGHHGILTIRFSEDLEYNVYITHSAKGYSQFNPNHGADKVFKWRGRQLIDAVTHGHIHEGVNMFDNLIDDYTRGIAIRTGAYVLPGYDQFGERIAGLLADATTPAIVFHPKKRKMIAFVDLEDALDFIKAKNEND